MKERKLWVSYLSNSKGLSLIEVLIAITILTLVTSPFLGIFLSTEFTNTDSQNITSASAMAQKAMEEIKSNPDLLAGHCDANIYTYEVNGKFTTKYSISKVSENIEQNGINVIENIDTTAFDLFFYVKSSVFEMLSESFPLKDNSYLLQISGSSSPYSYTLKGGTDNVLKNGNISSDTEPVRIKFQVSGERLPTDYDLDMKVNIDSLNVLKDVYVYVVDDNSSNSAITLTNTGIRPFFIYSSVKSGFKLHSNILYKIEVTVFNDNLENSKLVSYVKK